MAITKRADSVRWTPATIRKALLHPKPKGALARFRALTHNLAEDGPPRLPIDLRTLEHIADHADYLDLPVPKTAALWECVGWLLVPVPAWLVDALAGFAAHSEDLEPAEDMEDVGDFEEHCDDELDGSEEPDGTDELSIVRPDTMNRGGLESAVPISINASANHQPITHAELGTLRLIGTAVAARRPL